MDRVLSIQYLRALAAIGVVVYHFMESQPQKFLVGAAGVDIFFIISGFIMASLTLGKESAPGVFLWRRAIRIIPLYWLATLAAFALMQVRPTFFYLGDGSVENLALSLLFLPHASTTDGVTPTLQQGWTLEYEMFFYLLCTLALFLPARHRLKLLCGALVALVAAGFLLKGIPLPWRIYASQLMLEFVAGIALAAAWREKKLPPAIIGAAALLAGFAIFTMQHLHVLPHTYVRIIDWGMPAFLIVVGALSLEAAGRVPRLSAGLLLGDASYSLYLTHNIVLAFIVWYAPRALPEWTFFPLYIAAVIAVSVASFLLLERPLTGALKNVWGRRAPSPVAEPAKS